MSPTPEEFYRKHFKMENRHRRWDDKLLMIRLFVRGVLILILLALVAFFLDRMLP